MKLSTKLIAAPLSTAVVALGAGAAFALLMHANATQDRHETAEDIGHYRALDAAQARLGVTQSGVYRTLAILNSTDEARLKAIVAGVRKDVDTVRAVLGELAEGHAPDSPVRQRAEALEPVATHFATQVAKALELSAVEVNMGVGAMKAAEKSFDELTRGLADLAALTAKDYEARQDAAQRTELRLALALGALAALAIGGVVAGAWVMQRRLTADVACALALSREVAAGNLMAEAPCRRDDEIGELMEALRGMVVQLRGSMRTVHEATQSMGTAAREIASGNADLSQRTELTASSLQQSASAMEQLTGNVTQTADSARTATQLAASASGVAQRGGEVVARVVATMDDINAASKRIADIIGVIDGIAFQTNILALNAAVEAARAGEQGRGFAVVAGEVRSLAQRSAEAAREIKGLIGASVDKVESGARLVADAGTTMDEIVTSVRRVTEVIDEISAAAAEQSKGIGQVSGTVAQIDRATQQNAALVEQSAAGACPEFCV